jgi:hypothetical protein
MSNETTNRNSRASIIVALASGLAAVALTVLATVSIVTWQEAATPDATVDDSREFFESIRLSDSQVARLGLEASNGGLQPSTLATASERIRYEWRNAKGEPAECLFAGWYPGTSIYPVTGRESNDDPLWTERVISGTQTLGYDGTPYVNVTARLFASEEAAIEHLEGWESLVAGCPEYTSEHSQLVTTTLVDYLRYPELSADNAGWLSSTPELNIASPAADPEFIPADFFVLDVRQQNVVVRVTMFSPTDSGNDQAFRDLIAVVSANLERALR